MLSRSAVFQAARRYCSLPAHSHYHPSRHVDQTQNAGPLLSQLPPNSYAQHLSRVRTASRAGLKTQISHAADAQQAVARVCVREFCRAASRGLVTVVDKAAPRPHRSVRKRVRAAWAHTLGAGRKGPVLTQRQAALIANASFLLVASSFLQTDMYMLRAMNISSGLLMFVFNSLSMERPMWVSMRWGCVLIMINAWQVWLLHMESRQGILPAREDAVYRNWFGSLLSEAQFLRLSALAQWDGLEEGATMTRQGEPNEYLYLVTSGEVSISRDGRKLAALGPGMWVGERGFLRHLTDLEVAPRDELQAPSFASASVTSGSASVMRWRRLDMEEVCLYRLRVAFIVNSTITGLCRG
jgi:Cyclic nucleotide-binding domain